MIKINFQKNDDQINEVIISGHSMFADYGKDIVCAAVSSIVTTTINGILIINDQAIYYENKETFKIINQSFDEITNKLLDNLHNLLIDLQKDYPKNIEIGEEVK